MDRTVADTIGAIYDCALDASLWPDALERLRRTINGHNAALSVNAVPSGALLRNVSVNISDEYQALMARLAPDAVELWGGLDRVAAFPMFEPYIVSAMADERAMRSNRYVLEWAEPQGIVDAVGMFVARERDIVGSVAFGRHRTAGPFAASELDLLRAVSPHLRRAVAINALLDFRTIRAATFETVLDGVGSAVLLVDKAMRLVHANQAGRAEIERGAIVALRQGTLHLADRKAAGKLAAMLAANDPGRPAGSGLAVAARARDGAPAIIHVLPLAPRDPQGLHRPSATAALFIAPAAQPSASPLAAFAELYDLTPAEARVAELIAEGLSPGMIARRIGASEATVRTHLLRAFQKSGVSRQADLARLLRSFAGPTSQA